MNEDLNELYEDGEFEEEIPDKLEKCKEKLELAQLRLKLLELLLEKYAPIINEHEKKTVGEIKGLVNGEDLTIQGILNELKPEHYEFEKHYLSVAERAYDFVRKEIKYVDPKVEVDFWLTPSEVFSKGVADDEDIAVFLCSMLAGLGDKNAYVVIAELDDMTTHAFVVTEYKGIFYLLDPVQGKPFSYYSGAKRFVLAKYAYRGAKIKRFLYKFNNQEYKQFI
jgi:hypothetical protein